MNSHFTIQVVSAVNSPISFLDTIKVRSLTIENKEYNGLRSTSSITVKVESLI